jgi:hypothetical protein
MTTGAFIGPINNNLLLAGKLEKNSNCKCLLRIIAEHDNTRDVASPFSMLARQFPLLPARIVQRLYICAEKSWFALRGRQKVA